jgi:endonuclease-8
VPPGADWRHDVIVSLLFLFQQQTHNHVVGGPSGPHAGVAGRVWGAAGDTGGVPEGDVVWHTAGQLHRALAGRVLTVSDFRVPRYATTSLAGRVVTETVPRGKHLLTRVEGGVTVHTHLKMDGRWRVGRPGRYPPRDYRIRLIMANQEWQAVGYLLGIVEVLPTAAEDRAVGHLGPDLLGPDWDAAEAVRRLLAEPGRPVGEALMDQRNLAGIGNVYKSETLFLRGISPWQRAGQVPDLPAVVELARQLLDVNKDRVPRITTGSLARGEDVWVYGRAGRPCRRCGTRIQQADQGPATQERITYWCPRCQPEPK